MSSIRRIDKKKKKKKVAVVNVTNFITINSKKLRNAAVSLFFFSFFCFKIELGSLCTLPSAMALSIEVLFCLIYQNKIEYTQH